MRLGHLAEQIRQAEAPHLAAGEPLMARAAAAVADVVRDVLTQRGTPTGRVLVLAGPGNNAGDALFAAAELAEGGSTVEIIQIADRTHTGGLTAALEAGARLAAADLDAEAIRELGASADVVLDGIVGTGSSPGLRGRGRDVVAALLPLLEAADRPSVVAVDIPSGIGTDDGSVPDDVVLTADVTVTFGGYKAGLLLEPGKSKAGEVRLIPIGIEAELARMEPAVS